ncbi:MAG: hypothetical protein A2744_03175 [Candidatus Buchananbacteria bacterium RIFCSPHIGHO2_01_FULL_44_11]|uniref:DUF4012 domain-containing protein n=1 Tax=Candidatus Buchananbacteria bacterium RIFCSPHIGHO2_01_FULL_44_11 TaxID=1797535 RepID=A0A1G1Y270_9BACT|nr:MAG: hypothetical protein A2744_03175 [Candidatus Buchananbacteria bacterium RIFCSPHIGHO2_01_FULL_44_11]
MAYQKKKLIKTKTGKSPSLSLQAIAVKTDTAEKSSYLVNLKNPNQSFFAPEKKLAAEPLPTGKNSLLTKPPRALPKKNKNIQVNFIRQVGNNSAQSLNLGLSKKISHQKRSNFFASQEVEVEDIFAPPVSQNAKFNFYKQIVIFPVVALLLILPFQAYTYYQKLQATKDRVLFLSNSAIDSLKAAQQATIRFDLAAASSEFSQAKQNFVLAHQQIDAVNGLALEVVKLLPSQGGSLSAGLSLLEAGEILAEIGQILSTAGNNFLDNPTNDYYQALVQLEAQFKIAIEKFTLAKEKIQGISLKDLPPEHQENFSKVKTALPELEKGLGDLYLINSALLKLLGHDQWQRYLIMFANNNELRGSGGFLGSFALADIDRGKIKKMEIPAGGTYDLQGQLIPRVISPEPLHLINPRWEFQDANWWPDYPTSAKKIQWFYENAGGPTTDGVILMTASLMSELLAVLGPIELSQFNTVVSQANFVEETQKIIRLERDKESTQPKQILADLGPQILERLFSVTGSDFLDLLDVLKRGLNEKQLLLYFTDPELEKIVLSFDWGGKIKETEGDYLSVVESNIAGGKTDEVIEDTIEHQAEIEADGSVVDTVKLTRTHQGPTDQNPFTGVQNNSYVRFYVPGGSTLVEAVGFAKPDEKYFDQPDESLKNDLDLISVETNKVYDQPSGTDIYWEEGKTVFGNWLSLKPGETKTVTVKYRLPFKIAPNSLLEQNKQDAFYYSLVVQKQSGARGSDLTSTLKLNDRLKSVARFPLTLAEDDKQIIFKQKLNTDQFYSVVLVNQ